MLPNFDGLLRCGLRVLRLARIYRGWERTDRSCLKTAWSGGKVVQRGEGTEGLRGWMDDGRTRPATRRGYVTVSVINRRMQGKVGSKGCKAEADAAGECVGRRFLGTELDEVDGVGEVVGAQDEPIGFEGDIAEAEKIAGADGEECGLGNAVGGERAVVAVDDQQCVGLDDGPHGLGFVGGRADGDEAEPFAAAGGAARAKVFDHGGGHFELVEDGAGCDLVVVDGGGLGDEGNGDPGGFVFEVGLLKVEGCLSFGGDEIADGDGHGIEDAIDGAEAEHAFLVEEVGDVGLAVSGLAREQGPGEGAALDAAQDFDAKFFMQLCKVHLWNFALEL